MIETIHERISVLTGFRRDIADIIIYRVRWNGRDYHISKMGYHHRVRAGRNIFHFFQVNNDYITFKLEFDPENLTWWLVEVSEGNP